MLGPCRSFPLPPMTHETAGVWIVRSSQAICIGYDGNISLYDESNGGMSCLIAADEISN